MGDAQIQNIDRRKFLTGLGCGALGLAGSASLTGCAAPKICPDTAIKNAIKADVLVVGAGPSGIPAAIGAARAGAKVILIEEDMVPGGTAVDAYVSMPCGNPRTGLYLEMLDRLKRDYALPGSSRKWFTPESYIAVHWQMIEAEKNLKLICGAKAISAIVDDKGLRPRVNGAVVVTIHNILDN